MAFYFNTSPDHRYFEDYLPGAVHEFGSIPVDEQEVIELGRRYVPLSYRIDKEAAKKSIYGGVIASGWHTGRADDASLQRKLSFPGREPGLPRRRRMRWDKPVFPGDVLSVRATVLETRRSESRPRPRHRPNFYRSSQSKTRSGDEHEDGEFRQIPKRQALRVVPWPNTRCYLV
jgi:acyl dehydratase